MALPTRVLGLGEQLKVNEKQMAELDSEAARAAGKRFAPVTAETFPTVGPRPGRTFLARLES